MDGPPAKTHDIKHFSIAALTKSQRRFLLARSDSRGTIQLAGHIGLIFVNSLLIHLEIPYWPSLLFSQGILVMFLFSAMHEAIHRTAFRTRWCNRAVAIICGLIVALPPEWFRHFHTDHHRFTNDPLRDPELLTDKPKTRTAYYFFLSGLPIWWARIKMFYNNSTGKIRDGFIPISAKSAVVAESRLFLAIYSTAFVISYTFESTLLLWIWVIPILLGQPFLRAYLLAEHTGCAEVSNMFRNSRSIYTSAPIRFIAWNMPYHAEHHALQTVPFHKLPALHNLTRHELKVRANGYLNVHKNIWAGLN